MPNSRSLRAALGRQPVARPGRREHLFQRPPRDTRLLERFADRAPDHFCRRTTRIGGREAHMQRASSPAHETHDAQIHDAQHRDLRVRHAASTRQTACSRHRGASLRRAASPLRTRIRSLQMLHLRQHVAEMLRVHAPLAVPRICERSRDASASPPAALHRCAPTNAARSSASRGATPAAASRSSISSGGEQLVGEPPQLHRRRLAHARGSPRVPSPRRTSQPPLKR